MEESLSRSGRRFHNILTKEFLEQVYIRDLMNIEQVARKVGTSPHTVSTYIHRHGIPLHAKRITLYPPVKISGFLQPDDWHAYWIGFIAADGTISDTQGLRLQLAIAEEDKYLLENFAVGIHAQNPITICVNSGFAPNNLAKIVIYGAPLVAALSQWGIVPRKSLNLQWADNLPDHLISAYIRGFFDGDGTVYQRYRRVKETHQGWTETSCRFISGSQQFLDRLRFELNKRDIKTNKTFQNHPGNAFVLPLSGKKENLIAFANLIYHNQTICLERKQQVFNRLLKA